MLQVRPRATIPGPLIRSMGHPCAQIVPIKPAQNEVTTDPAFGMWESHKDKKDIHKFIRKLSEGRSL